MLVYLFIVICIMYILFAWRCNAKCAKLPSYPGALPLIGNAHLLIANKSLLWERLKKVSMESIKQGGAINVFIGPFGEAVLTDPDDCGIVMNSTLEKHYVYRFAKEWFGEGLLVIEAKMWPKHRKMLNPLFNQQTLNGFLGLFNMEAKRFVSLIAAEEGKGPFDHQRYLSLIALETICKSALGLRLDDQIERNEEYLHAISGLLDQIMERFSKVWLHSDYIFKWSSLKKKLDANVKLIHNMSNTVLQERKAILRQKSCEDTGSAGHFIPFIDRILKITMEKGDFTDKEIRDELNTIIMGGHDTTAGALVYVLMLLGSHQSVQDRVYEEIQEVFDKSDRDVEKQDLPRLVYMEAVLKETLRLYPVAPFLARYNSREIKLKNCTLPAGSNCFISVYGLHRHPVWGPDAEEFRPERWLDPGSLPDNPNAYGGFGLGKRGCIGKTYGMMSMKTSLVHVLRKYRVSSDITKLALKVDVLLKPVSGQHIKIYPRTKYT